MEQSATEVVSSLGDLDGVERLYSTDLRYAGQGHELEIAFVDGKPDPSALRRDFEVAYKALFGRTLPGATIMAVSWRIRLSKHIATEKIMLPNPIAPADAAAGSGQERDVFNLASRQLEPTSIVDRAQLTMETQVSGPALIVESQTTTVVPTSYTASLLPGGHLVLTKVSQKGVVA